LNPERLLQLSIRRGIPDMDKSLHSKKHMSIYLSDEPSAHEGLFYEYFECDVIYSTEFDGGTLYCAIHNIPGKRHSTLDNAVKRIDSEIGLRNGVSNFRCISDVGSKKVKTFGPYQHRHDVHYLAIFSNKTAGSGSKKKVHANVRTWTPPKETDDTNGNAETNTTKQNFFSIPQSIHLRQVSNSSVTDNITNPLQSVDSEHPINNLQTKLIQSQTMVEELKSKVLTLEQQIEELKAEEKATDFTEVIKRDEYERKRKLEQEQDEEREYRRNRERERDNEQKEQERDQKMRKAITEYVHGDFTTRLTIEPTLSDLLQHRYKDETARANFIKSLAASNGKKQSIEYAGVYTLKMQGMPFKYYVGSSQTVMARIAQHIRGEGAVCTYGATLIEQLPLVTMGSIECIDDWERGETLTLMYTMGINQVRGWRYVQRELTDQQKEDIIGNICSRNTLCHRCGFGSHMISNCRARRSSFWMGGGALT